MRERDTARPQVPSAREQRLGKQVPTPRFEREVEAAAPVSRREALRAYFENLHPSRVAGSASPLPMLMLALIGFLDAIEGAGGILFPEMIKEFHIQLVELTALNAALNTPVLLLGLYGGFVADRVHRVRLYFIAKLVQAFGVIGVGASRGLGQWALAQGVGVTAFGGAAAAFSSPARDSLLADYYPPDVRGTVYGTLYLGILGGQLIGPLLAGVLGGKYGWRFPYLVLGTFGIAVSFLAFFLREPARGVQDRIAAGADPEAAIHEQKPAGFGESWRAVYSVATIRRLYIAQVAWGIGGIMFAGVLLYNLGIKYHVPPVARGLSVSLGTAVGLIAITTTMPMVNALIARAPGQVMVLMGAVQLVNCVVFLLGAALANAFVGLAELVVLTAINAPLIPTQSALLSLTVPARVRSFGFKASVPFSILSGILGIGAVALAVSIPALGMLVGIPIFLAGAITVLTGAGSVDRDIRAARAAAMAEEEALRARREGREKVLVCRDLDVHYGQVQVIFNVDFDVARGDLVALLGTNGAGKSTILRAISGLTEASNGAIFLGGEDITHAPPHVLARKGVVLMSGGRGIFPGMTVGENLRAAGWLAGEEPEQLQAQTRRVLDEFFPVLKERLNQKAGSLSGGEQQQLGLGMAFLMKAELLLIDELSLGLSPAVVKRLLEVVREVNRAGTTVILVEQSVEVALQIARRAVVLEKGEVTFTGTAEELREHPEVLKSLFLASASRGGGLFGGPARQQAVETDGRPEPVLVVEDLTVRHGGIRAVDGVSLQAGRGEVVGLIGPNGAGKTTLFDAITGFVPVESGRVIFAGKDATYLSPTLRARAGLVRSFQDARLFPSMTVRENLLTALERHAKATTALSSALWLPSVRRQELRLDRRAQQLIELFDLGAHEDRFVTELSTGVHRVVDLACVMAADPEILLLDEPSAGLSQAETEEMGPLLLRLRRETGLGLVVIEHDIKLITAVSDHVIALDLGRVIAQGTPDEVVNDPAVVRSYLGAAAEAETATATAGGVR